MSKEFTLVDLRKNGAIYRAVMYNRLDGYYKAYCFWYYSKREVIQKLRNEHDCIVARRFT